jgi:hypothetical protein
VQTGSYTVFILSRFRSHYRRGLYCWMDLLTTFTHDSELHTITALSLIYILYKSLQQPPKLFQRAVFSWSLATASNSAASSASSARLLSSQAPVQNCLNFQLNWLRATYITTDGQSASLSWYQAPIWGLWPDFYYCQTLAGLLICGAISDERTGLSCTIAVVFASSNSSGYHN